ncbi:MAG: efflux RND transporter permease subunit [Betaproteobacteria bacterium]|nr:efflux RND transporter permease subunit [Betaproteobacteria bacterium]
MTELAPRGLQQSLISFAVRFRGIVIALACMLAIYGVYDLSHASYSVFPEFAPPQATIQTEAAGLSPDQVEALVTTPLERVINGVPGVEALRSTSIQGLSAIHVYFDRGSDIYRDRQLVAERLATASHDLPQGIAPPTLTPLTSSTATTLVVGLSSRTASPMTLRTIADWTVRPRLLAVPGVADVVVFGGDLRSVQIQVHPEKLISYGLSLQDILAAARQATGVHGAGFIDTANQRIVIQPQGQMLTPAQIARTVVVAQGAGRVTLGDIADVVVAPEPPTGAATIGGRPSVVINISNQYGSNTLAVTRRLDAALRDLKPALAAQDITLHPALFRPANFVETAIGNVETSLLFGSILVAVVLFLFLFDLRTAAISCLAIPLSLLSGTLVLGAFGGGLNTLTLGGLAIAIGEVVDDAVIGVENIVRRLRENEGVSQPRPRAAVVFDAVFEVRSAVVYATFAVILVFAPVVALPGLAGRLFGPLAIAYIAAVLASLVVALTLTPALSLLLIRRSDEVEPPVSRWLRGRYERLLSRVFDRPRPVGIVVTLLTVTSLAVLPFLGGNFIPPMREGHYIVHATLAPGSSIEQSMRIGAILSKRLSAIPGVRSVAQRIGRAPRGEDTAGPQSSELEVDLEPLDGAQSRIVDQRIAKAISGLAGVQTSFNTFLTERVEETLSGYTAPVAIGVYGPDLDGLDQVANSIASALRAVHGASGVRIQSPPGLPELQVALREPDLVRWGLTPDEVLDAVGAAFQGQVSGQLYDGDRTFDLITILSPAARRSASTVDALPIRTPSGAFIRLKDVADVRYAPGRYQIQHEGGRRVQTVTTEVRGRDVASFVAAAKRAIAKNVNLPKGTYLTFGGTAQAQAQAQRALLLNSGLAAIGIVLLLSIVAASMRNVMLILANLPFALAGGALAVLVTGGTLSLGAIVGFVTLFGITLRNSILMIAHFQHLVGEEGASWNQETAIRGAADRLAPIMMTSIVTALGLLPLALGMHDPGREIEGALAVVILGGLITSMVLNLLVLPVLSLRYGRFDRPVGASDQ